MLIEDGLPKAEFPHIDFRDSPAGRQAYVRGSGLAVWEVLLVAQGYRMDVARTAEHFQWPAARVQGAFDYAEAFPEEIEQALHEHDSFDFAALKAVLPQAELFHVNNHESPIRAASSRPQGA